MIQKVIKNLKDLITSNLQSEVSIRIVKGTFWGTFGGIVTRVFTIIFSFLLARVMGSAILGEYGMINSTTSTISGLAGLGLGATVSRYSATLISTNKQRLGRIIGLTFIIGWISSLIYGLVYYFLADWLAIHFLNAPHLGELMKISSFTFVFGLINSIQTSSLTGLEAFKITSILTSITTIFQTFLILLFAYFFGLKGAIVSGSITSFVIFLIFYFYSRKEYSRRGIVVSFNNMKSELSVIWNYSLPAFLSSLIMGPVIWITNTLLINQQNGFQELGIVNVALQWDNVVRFIPMYIGAASIPVMADITINKNYNEGFKLTVHLMKTIFLISLPIATIIAFLSPFIIKGYGKTFLGGEYAMVITAFTTVLILTSNQLGNFISATGKMWVGFTLNLIWGLSFVSFTYILVDNGSAGLVNSRLIAYGIHLTLSILLCLYFIKSKNYK